jgi:hypothetical protein
MVEIRAITYEDARLDYFIKQRAATRRRLKYWAAKAAKAKSPLARSIDMVSDVADEWHYLNDVIGLLGGPKEEVCR